MTVIGGWATADPEAAALDLVTRSSTWNFGVLSKLFGANADSSTIIPSSIDAIMKNPQLTVQEFRVGPVGTLTAEMKSRMQIVSQSVFGPPPS